MFDDYHDTGASADYKSPPPSLPGVEPFKNIPLIYSSDQDGLVIASQHPRGQIADFPTELTLSGPLNSVVDERCPCANLEQNARMSSPIRSDTVSSR